MRRDSGALHSLRRLSVVALGTFVVLYAAMAMAGVSTSASSARWTGATATGARTAVTVDAVYTGTINGARTFTVPVPVASSTLGALTRGALRRALPIAGWATLLRDLVGGAGWVIDELQKQVVQPATGQDAPAGTRMLCTVESPTRCSSTVSGGLSLCNSLYGGCSVLVEESGYVQYRRTPPEGLGDVMQMNWTYIPEPRFDWATGSPQRTITDEELGNLVKANAEVVNAILIDPETGAPLRTAELVNALNQLRAALEAQAGMEPGTDLTPAEDLADSETKESQWPGFCDWAKYVCDAIDWMKKEPDLQEVPVPMEEASVEMQNWSSGLGGGQCPAPLTVNVSLGAASQQIDFTFEPLCQFAQMMFPVVTAMGLLLGAYIVAGVRQSNG